MSKRITPYGRRLSLAAAASLAHDEAKHKAYSEQGKREELEATPLPGNRKARRRAASMDRRRSKPAPLKIVEIDESLTEKSKQDDAPEPSSFEGKLNIYTCNKCFGHIVTKDIARGVTPFMVDCKATDGCNGMMESSFYRVWDQRMAPDYEWYRPDEHERLGLSVWSADHVAKGGLLLRKART